MAETKKVNSNRHRFTATVDDDLYQAIIYWSGKKELSINDFLRESLSFYIAHQNKDYDLPTLEIQRLNQLVDSMYVLSENVGSLEKIIVSGFDSLLSLTRGDNYLLDEEDGELYVDVDAG